MSNYAVCIMRIARNYTRTQPHNSGRVKRNLERFIEMFVQFAQHINTNLYMRYDSSRISSFRCLISANHRTMRLSLSSSIASSVSASNHAPTLTRLDTRLTTIFQNNLGTPVSQCLHSGFYWS